MNLLILCVLSSVSFLELVLGEDDVKFATPCEVCKLVSNELEARLVETGRSHDVIETGYHIDAKKKTKTKYKASYVVSSFTKSTLCFTENIDMLQAPTHQTNFSVLTEFFIV